MTADTPTPALDALATKLHRDSVDDLDVVLFLRDMVDCEDVANWLVANPRPVLAALLEAHGAEEVMDWLAATGAVQRIPASPHFNSVDLWRLAPSSEES